MTEEDRLRLEDALELAKLERDEARDAAEEWEAVAKAFSDELWRVRMNKGAK